jgi:hypothetical protein
MHPEAPTRLLNKFDAADLECGAYGFDAAAPRLGPLELEIARRGTHPQPRPNALLSR